MLEIGRMLINPSTPPADRAYCLIRFLAGTHSLADLLLISDKLLRNNDFNRQIIKGKGQLEDGQSVFDFNRRNQKHTKLN